MNQLGRCLLCGEKVDPMESSCHTDHCHQTGKIRGALCRGCNTLSGLIHHKFVRSGLKGVGIDYHQWLTNMLVYVKQDYSENDFHPQHPVDQTKQFKKLGVTDMRNMLDRLGIAYPEKATKVAMAKLYRKSFLANPRCDFDNGERY